MKDNKIHNTIKALRFHNNEMTQQELAEKVGATRQSIMSIEKGIFI